MGLTAEKISPEVTQYSDALPMAWITSLSQEAETQETESEEPKLPEYRNFASDIDYINQAKSFYESRIGRIPAKLKAQEMLKKAGIGDPDTVVSMYTDTDRVDKVIQSFTHNGRSPVWISWIHPHEFTDENAPSEGRIRSKLIRDIRHLSDWHAYRHLIEKNQYFDITENQRLDLELLGMKIFPQDVKYSHTAISATENGIYISTKLNQMSGREKDKARSIVNIRIDESSNFDKKITVASNHPQAGQVLSALTSTSSLRKFKIFEEELAWKYPKLNTKNPELMLDPKQRQIAFFFDFISGAAGSNKPPAVNIYEILRKISSASEIAILNR